MTSLSPQTVYDNLKLLEQVDSVRGASYRQQVFDVLSDPTVSMSWRQRIIDRLNRANQMLALLSVGSEDSY